MEFRIDEYINEGNPKDSICREERQYALFLYNIFMRVKNQQESNPEGALDEGLQKIVYYCLDPREAKRIWEAKSRYESKEKKIIELPFKILDVYYEATFMRDYFQKDYEKAMDKYKKDHSKEVGRAEAFKSIRKKYNENETWEKEAGEKEDSFNTQLLDYCCVS